MDATDANRAEDVTPGGRRKAGSHTVTVPPDLLEAARAVNPDLQLSALLQEALRGLAGCQHEELACARCGAPLRQADIVERVLTRFYADVQGLVGDQARRGRTVEGLARRVKELGEAHQLRIARETPMPGLTRAERQAAKVKDLPPRPPPVTKAIRSVPADPSSVEAG